MEFFFWLCVFLILYPYAGYPLLISLYAKLQPRPVAARPLFPEITILIAAYNESACIAATIENKLAQDYPEERRHIIVVSDGSDDGTDEIVMRYADRGVELMRTAGRAGKAAALNMAAQKARGEIIVFSDANSIFDRDAIRYMVEDFADTNIGYVTGFLAFIAQGESVIDAGVGAYNRYEEILRRAETRAGSIIGVNGGVGAIRRDLYKDVPPHLITDFVLPLSVIAAGYRVVYDERVRSQEEANAELGSEFRMRVRVALRAMQGISYMRVLLNPWRYPLASFCLVSHKVIRYMTFLFLIGALLSNIILATSSQVYLILLGLHIACYGLALLGLGVKVLPLWIRRITAVPSYLVMTCAAFAIATFRFLKRDTMTIWRPRGG